MCDDFIVQEFSSNAQHLHINLTRLLDHVIVCLACVNIGLNCLNIYMLASPDNRPQILMLLNTAKWR